MKYAVIQRILGFLIMVFSGSLIPPIIVSLLYQDGGSQPFTLTFVGSLLTGLLIWYPVRKANDDLRAREGFFIVAMFWVVLSSIASLPFHFSAAPHLAYTDAFFEAVSALTTTGATVIVGIDQLPHSILWYRQQLQWMGGLGIIVIALAVLPIIGVGGMGLFRAEMSSAGESDKLTPRMRETALGFFKVYAFITALCVVAYYFAGMNFFDAIGHAFATVSTGGFSTHDASLAYFESDLIEVIAIVFMIAGGISFALHFVVLRDRSLSAYLANSECRTFLLVLLLVTLVSTGYLAYTGRHDNVFDAVLTAAFNVVSVMTSTGFTTDFFAGWPAFLPVLLMFISIMGACAGSTSGGMKVIRFQLLFRQGAREVNKLIHPNAEYTIKHNGRPVPDRVLESIWGFFAAYTIVYVILMLLMIASGLDQVSAFSAIAATLNNLGPGLGEVSSTFVSVSDFGKWVGIAGMLMGRLEIFTVLVLLTPDFWRH